MVLTFLEKLDLLMETDGINKSKLSQISGVPYTTIDAFYKKGYENAKISTIRKIAKAFDCSLDYLIEDEPKKSPSTAEAAPGDIHELSPRMTALYAAMNQLNDQGQEKVLEYADDLVSSGKYIKSDPAGLGKEA